MSGGKGGSQTTEVKVPQYIEDAARASLAKADLLAQIGYTPYYGPDVAAFTPMQEAAFQNTANAASAFGLGGGTGMEGMPAPTEYAGGIRGYSSAPMFEQSVDQLRQRRPGQYEALNAPFIDPVTGVAPAYPYTGSTGGGMPQDDMTPALPSQAVNRRDYDDRGNGGGMGEGMGAPAGAASGGMFGGYSDLGDMSDGGGPGQSGSEFGGALGGISNAVGATPSGSGEGGGGGGDKVICTALHGLGLLPDDVYELDAAFGQRVNREDPALGDGYRLWANPVAEYIKGDRLGSKLARILITPIAKAWAAQMAHMMRPSDYAPNLAGKVVMAVGHPVCRTIGRLMAGATQEKDA